VAKTLVLAIKPQQFAGLKQEIKAHAPNGMLVSILAGIPAASLAEITPNVGRVIPNLPSVLGEGSMEAYVSLFENHLDEFKKICHKIT
jgi:pyrroline-5-carboxylate reductase